MNWPSLPVRVDKTLVLVLLLSGPAQAATIIAGRLTDATTGGPIAGAAVTIRQADRAIGIDRSDVHGDYQLSFDLPNRRDPQQVKLIVEHEQYVQASGEVTVISGAADKEAYPFALVPKLIEGCRIDKGHAIVVGHFRPPATGPQPVDLAARIRDALEYDLLPQIQKGDAIRKDPAIILVCDKADPRSVAFYASFARALAAEAFVSGYVKNAGTKVAVEMRVADRFDVLVPPAQVTSRPVDLDDPAAARFGPAAHAPILVALALGYEKAGQQAHCIELTAAAESILGRLTPELRAIRERCQQRVPNRGLLPGG